MKHAFFSLLATSAAVSAFGMVDISNATVSQGFGTRDVTVSYDIISTDEPTHACLHRVRRAHQRRLDRA